MSEAMSRTSVTVANARRIAQDIKQLDLTPTDGQVLPPVEPGAHLDLWLPNGQVRQYSIVARAEDGAHYRIAVLRDSNSRGGSAYVVETVEEGHRLEIGGLRNHFALDEGADDYVLIAGGIGVTPLIPMAYRLLERGKPFVLHYLNRSRPRAAFLDTLQAEPLSRHLHLHFDETHGVPDLATMIGPPRAGTRVYVCGPSGLIDAVLDAARQWPPDAVRFERFTRDSGESGTDAVAFEVELAQSGQVVAVGPNETILDVLEKAGVAVESVCKEGICGSCMVPMLSGEADHRDSIQTEAEQKANEFICVCVSRAISPRLVLDL